MQGINANQLAILQALKVLPHTLEREEELKCLKIGPKRLTLLGRRHHMCGGKHCDRKHPRLQTGPLASSKIWTK